LPESPESVRIEVAIAGGPTIAANVSPASADALEHALASGSQGTHQLDTDDGRAAIVLVVPAPDPATLTVIVVAADCPGAGILARTALARP